MWLNRCLLGSGYAPILVIVGLQRLWLPWTRNSRRRQDGRKTTGRMEKEKKKLEGAGDSAARFSYALLRLREGYAHVAFAVLAEAYARRYGNA